jgi:hypothetical protein
MQTYKIIFKLNTPVAFIDRPTFDGILAYAYAKNRLGGAGMAQKLNIPKSELINFSEMPLQQHPDGYFIASSMFYDEERAVEFTEKWRKRWANKYDHLADFGKQKRKIRVNAGQYKSYDMPLRVVRIDQVWFYFRTDRQQEVGRLLNNFIHFIGKKRSQGYGEIDRYIFEESDYPFTDIYRPIPVRFLDWHNFEGQATIREHSWKPPYWLPENIETCAIPITHEAILNHSK